MLTYDWFKIALFACLACFVWVCTFTFTGTKITNTQEFTVFNHKTNGLLTDDFYSLVTSSTSDGTFSYEVLETQVTDLSDKQDHTTTFYDSYLGAGVGDLIFLTYAESTEEKQSEADWLLNRYFYYMQPVDSFVSEMKTYVSAYYPNGNYATGEMDKAKVEEDFRALIRKNKDKRFKSSKQIANGLLIEYARIQSYATALVEFDSFLSDGLICYQSMVAGENEPRNYFLNLCPNNATMGGLKKYLYELQQPDNLKTALNMGVFFLNLEDSEPCYRYESLLFVNKLIKASK